MITIVRKTVFSNPSQLTSGSFNLSAPSTVRNTLVIVSNVIYGYNQSPGVSLKTDQNEAFASKFGAVTSQVCHNIFVLVTTKTATSISFQPIGSGAPNAVGTFVVYELSSNNLLAYSGHDPSTCSSGSVTTWTFSGLPSITTNSIAFLLVGTAAAITNVSLAPTETDVLPANTGETVNVTSEVYNNISASIAPVFTISPSSGICVPGISISEILPPCATVQLINGNFQDVAGNVMANGYVTMQLSADAVSCTPAQVSSRIRVKIPLDANGNIQGTSGGTTYAVWGNDNLTPSGSTYAVRVYSASGQLVWGPWDVTVTSGTTFDCNTWTEVM